MDSVFLHENYEIFLIDKLDGIDISSNQLENHLDDISPDIIIHLAAHPGALSNANPITNVKVNCLGSMNVINGFKNKAKLILLAVLLFMVVSHQKKLMKIFQLNLKRFMQLIKL